MDYIRNEIKIISKPTEISLRKEQRNEIQKKSRPCPYKTHFSSSTAAIFINEDLLTEVFLHLPPKSLLRFQCISKHWKSIISNPTFRRLQRRLHSSISSNGGYPATAFCLLTKDQFKFIPLHEQNVNSMGIISFQLNSFRGDAPFAWFHSCNGLLCLLLRSARIFVYNPTTHQHRVIPDPPFIFARYRFFSLNIVFDPLKSDHYKFVFVKWLDGPGYSEFCFSIYASDTGVWHTKEQRLYRHSKFDGRFHFGDAILYNGDLHWCTYLLFILRFDMNKERFDLKMPSLPVPICIDPRFDPIRFCECGGYLKAVRLNDPGEKWIDVLQLERDYSQWVFKYHIDLFRLTTLYPWMLYEEEESWRVLHDCDIDILYMYEEDGKDRLLMALGQDRLLMAHPAPCKIISYNFGDMIVKELAEVVGCKEKTSLFNYDAIYAYKHCETLAAV